MKLPVLSLLLATTFGMTCGAHADGLTDAVDPGALAAYVKQAQAGSVRLAALPSTRAQAGKAATTPTANMDRAILDQLIEMNTTLRQLLQLEQAKAASGAH